MGVLNSAKTLSIQCPICGKEHILTFHFHNHLYLDTTPQLPMKKLLQRCVICDCGLLCFAEVNELYHPEQLVQTDRYQQILNASYITEEEKKLAIMYQGLRYPFAPLYYAHYYHQEGNELKRREWLNIAIQQTRDGKDIKMQRFFNKDFKNITFRDQFFYYPEDKLVEMYRQLGDFDKALLQIQLIDPKEYSDGRREFLEFERKLIQRKITNPQ